MARTESHASLDLFFVVYTFQSIHSPSTVHSQIIRISTMFFPIEPQLIGEPFRKSEFFAADKVFEFLATVDESDFDVSSGVPVLAYPTSPSTWLYFARKDGDQNFLADKYRWRDKSKNKTKTNIYRRFYIAVERDNQSDQRSRSCLFNSEFQRNVYYLSETIKENEPVIIAYRGNHLVYQKFPHGNSTNKLNFLSSTSGVKLEVSQRCKEITSVDTLFINLKADQRAELGSHHGQLLVRDPKQVANYRARKKQLYSMFPNYGQNFFPSLFSRLAPPFFSAVSLT